MVDFKKKLGKKEPEKKTDPIEIYKNLDRSSITGPLRPGQEKILSTWYQSHVNDKDLIIKLHTGEGKTLIGLLILLSKLNNGLGPALYVCPNVYLVQQACAEAAKFGIPFCVIGDDGVPAEFLDGQRILITHIQKLFNGKSIFGIGNNYTPIKNIILDDSHACIDAIKSSFTITLKRGSNKAYEKFTALFDEDVNKQGEGRWLEIKDGDNDSIMPIPYWAWIERKDEVLSILNEFKELDEVKFVWPIIRDRIADCQAFITGSQIEISPYFVPLHEFNSFNKAEQRILMSATTQDDSFFIKGLGFDVDAIRNPLTNGGSLWSGEKMILLPYLINEEFTRTRIINAVAPPNDSRKVGFVSLVPSFQKSDHYRDLGAKVASTKSIFEDVKLLKSGSARETLVIANRYDGIDLPDDACRLLIIDSLPISTSLLDRYEEMCRVNSELINIKVAQKIEQGLGRSVRGEKDFSVILLIGPDLVKFVRTSRTSKLFSTQTRKQIEIGLEISDEASKEFDENNMMKVVNDLIKQCLSRDEGWKEFYIEEMNKIKTDPPKENLYHILKLERDAEFAFYMKRPDKACEIMQKIVDNFSDNDQREERGWYLQQLARYKYFVSKTDSAKLQESAFSNNTSLMKPLNGIAYKKMEYISGERLKRIKDWFKQYVSYEEVSLAVQNILDNFSFGQPAEVFERALDELGKMLGFVCQRPDQTIGKGPDNLWGGVMDKFILFECKSEVKAERESITKHEAGQMNSHCGWFKKEYGDEVQVTNIMVIDTKDLSYYGDFTHPVVIMRKGMLNKFKRNIKSYILEFHKYSIHELDDDTIQGFLMHHQLLPDNMVSYTEKFKHLSSNPR
ncbi:DEAD/DEAH box helicase [Chitinophaga agri]|uniref:DEAD/DEAH box helicase family protein n=1 Tax=Chitinophaga agri TaxID=2703787 RepID=A0A6B9ZC80_9BACT|nr:DEAD/DEAH box helicase [Chitinophaga agri]QHS59928.1 DEAD/DEAH box helicase family protein [Chitinophaga agri]